MNFLDELEQASSFSKNEISVSKLMTGFESDLQHIDLLVSIMDIGSEGDVLTQLDISEITVALENENGLVEFGKKGFNKDLFREKIKDSDSKVKALFIKVCNAIVGLFQRVFKAIATFCKIILKAFDRFDASAKAAAVFGEAIFDDVEYYDVTDYVDNVLIKYTSLLKYVDRCILKLSMNMSIQDHVNMLCDFVSEIYKVVSGDHKTLVKGSMLTTEIQAVVEKKEILKAYDKLTSENKIESKKVKFRVLAQETILNDKKIQKHKHALDNLDDRFEIFISKLKEAIKKESEKLKGGMLTDEDFAAIVKVKSIGTLITHIGTGQMQLTAGFNAFARAWLHNVKIWNEYLREVNKKREDKYKGNKSKEGGKK